MSSQDCIKVAVRVRPLLKHELDAGSKPCLTVLQPVSQVQVRGLNIDEAFTYNHVFNTTHTQQDLYKTAVKPLITNLFSGYNVTVLAYGQTGSGKTHSMGTSCGSEDGSNDGVIPKSIIDIYEKIKTSPDCEFTVNVSFLELYNEQIRDLLQQSSGQVPVNLEVREDASGGVCIPGLTQVQVHSVEDTLSCLAQGSQFRSTGATAMNKTSSRSHAVFTIKIERAPLDGDRTTIAKFCLVDLAGSERAKKTMSTGDRFKEGVNINMGLLALGNVISALGDENRRSNHIPYRDSKLTRLLQDSLGGNSFTLMIACVSPADRNINESLNTLRYADRARRIKNKPVVNADPKAAEIGLLRSQVNQLQQLLGLERSKGFRTSTCPPGHQRLVDMVRGELTHSQQSTLLDRLKMASPRTRNYLRQIGLQLDLDEDDEIDGAPGDYMENEEDEKPSLFPRPRDLELSPDEQAGGAEDVAQQKQDFEQHTAKLTTKLQVMTRELQDKEAQVAELGVDSLAKIDEKCTQLQSQVSELVRQKNELEVVLQELQRQNTKTSAHLAEQRRLQIKDLERRITAQNKQLTDLSRLKLDRKRDAEKITNLNTEIQTLKQARVRLAREIKKSADNFRSWKQRQDREVGRLREAERKGRSQLEKQTSLFTRQQTVLQRKYQEAMASNKRLNAVLVRRNINATVAGQRSAAENAEKLQAWLEQELEVERSLALTRETLDQLLAERSRLKDKVKDLGSSQCWEDRISHNKRLNETRQINSQITLQSSQISELERKLLGVEISDSKSPHTRWVGVTSLSDARLLLSTLFSKTINTERELAARNERVTELEESQLNLSEQLKEVRNQLRDLQSKQDIKILQSPLTLMPPPSTVPCTPLQPIKENRSQAVTSVLKNRKVSLFSNPCMSDEESEPELDHPEKDPDWRLTPAEKEQRAKKARKRISQEEEEEADENSGPQRCSCKGKCVTKRCSCVKSSDSCAENCGCSAKHCQNRSSSGGEDEDCYDQLNSTQIVMGSTFNLKRDSTELSESFILPQEDVEVPKKRRLFTGSQCGPE